MRTHKPTRGGFTLVELIVVIGIIATLATLTALYFPRFQDKENVNRGADQLQMWLLSAKQMARRDGVPTGLRLIAEGPAGKRAARRAIYIQQPEDSAQGMFVFADNQPNATTPARAWFSLPTGKRFTNDPKEPVNAGEGLVVVRKGDYVEINGQVHRIHQARVYTPPPPGQDTFPPNALDLALSDPPKKVSGPDPMTIPAYAGQPINYRIFRQPEPLPGEQELPLPDNVIVDFNEDNPLNMQKVGSPPNQKGPMCRGIGKGAGPNSEDYHDILFSPSGALIGQHTGNGQVILWVRDVTRDNVTKDLLGGHATLITVQPRTGFIAAHAAASGNDPYMFTRDAKSSGL